jgi:HD superfamily phosphohydrolase
MTGKRDFRYDPLYRVVDVTDEIRFVEGNAKTQFDRLKGIANLGILPEVLEMAKYPKYEHHLGTVYQINCLLDMKKDTMDHKYCLPLKLSAIFLHVGHLPFTYSTERALLLASSSGTDDLNNKAKNYIKKRMKKVLQEADFDDKEQEEHLEKLFSIDNYKILYRYISCYIFLEKWKKIQREYELKDDDKATILKNLIDTKNDGYGYLELANKADFVQRDALYFGTVKLDISPKQLYGQELPGHTSEVFSIDEKKLIESNLDYLSERFYNSDRIRWVSRLYEKIVANLILSKNFKMEWLDNLDDPQFKRIITENSAPDSKPANLSKKWVKRAKDVFEDTIQFYRIFELSDISFEKQENVIDIEYKLLGKNESTRGLLAYPFEKGLLLDIDYLRRPRQRFPCHPNYRQFSVGIFQDGSLQFIELLKIIERLSHHCSISHVEAIRWGLCKQFSWTKSIRIDNKNVIDVISEAIANIEDGDFLIKFLKSISSIKTFDALWDNFENRALWLSHIRYIAGTHKEHIEDEDIWSYFVEGVLSLPVRLLQYESTNKYLVKVYEKIVEMIPATESSEKRGHLFEALWLIDRMQEKRGKFQFLINGMVVTDPTKPKRERDLHEFDVIELLINETGEAECWIYACSIADDYTQKNKEQLRELADNIHRVYPELKVRMRYVIPQDKSNGIWKPTEETEVGWN